MANMVNVRVGYREEELTCTDRFYMGFTVNHTIGQPPNPTTARFDPDEDLIARKRRRVNRCLHKQVERLADCFTWSRYCRLCRMAVLVENPEKWVRS